jgi:NOL1/NOP2/fmu family ribosome biogenesis protein
MKDDEQVKESLHIMNSREKKELNQRIMQQWGCDFDKSLVWLMSNKYKLYLSCKDIELIDLSKIRVDRIGAYVATVDDKSVRLSIEGTQILGPKADKNVVELSEKEMNDWFHGKDIDKEVTDASGFIILKCGDDFIGSGKITNKGILNFVPKTRRILSNS